VEDLEEWCVGSDVCGAGMDTMFGERARVRLIGGTGMAAVLCVYVADYW